MQPGRSLPVVVTFLALLCGTARAGDELQGLLDNLGRTEDPAARRELVDQLATQTVVRAAERLRDLVRTDPDPTVRVAAANALGASPVKECLDFLLDLLPEGGPHELRRAIAHSVTRRHGREALVALLRKELAKEPEKWGKDLLGPGLMIEALGEDPSLEAAAALEKFARGGDAFVRVEALRALFGHAAGRETMPQLLRQLLAKQHDLDTIMAGLDIAESLADAEFRDLADLLQTFLEPEVQGAVTAVRARLAYLDAVAAAKKAGKDHYGSAAPPDPPPVRPRVDIAYLFDASGSVCGHIDAIKRRIRREAETLARTGCDFRLGLVAYRDRGVPRQQWVTLTMPLTYDLAKAEAWIDSVSAGGCGTGSAMPDAFAESLSRMGWRWSARRQVALISDSGAGERSRAESIVRLHFLADRTRVDVWYLYRTRPKCPPDIERLARVGGGIVESLE
jgi:HEAT repeat protein